MKARDLGEAERVTFIRVSQDSSMKVTLTMPDRMSNFPPIEPKIVSRFHIMINARYFI